MRVWWGRAALAMHLAARGAMEHSTLAGKCCAGDVLPGVAARGPTALRATGLIFLKVGP